jgi:site-specific DNA recombinase
MSTQTSQYIPIEANSVEQTAACYIRVSTKRQSEEGYSVENQRSLAEMLCKEANLSLPEHLIFIDDAPASKSADKEIDKLNLKHNFNNRPEFQRLLASAENGEFKHLITYSRDRITRVLRDAIAIEVFLKKHDIKIHYTRSGEEISSNDDKITTFINTIMNAISEYESALLSSRVKDGNKSCIENGWWSGGSTPFGYVRVYDEESDKKKKHTLLVKSDFDEIPVSKIFCLYSDGYGYRTIASLMNSYFPYIKWTKAKIEAIVKNETYTGTLVWNRRSGRRNGFKKHKENEIVKSTKNKESAKIIDTELWQRCTQIREEHIKSKDPYFFRTSFVLKDKLKCPACATLLKGKNPGNGGDKYYYCPNNECKFKKENNRKFRVDSKYLHSLFTKNILESRNSKDNMTSILNELEQYHNKDIDSLRKFSSLLDDKIIEYSSRASEIINNLANQSDPKLKKALENQLVLSNKLKEQYNQTKKILCVDLDAAKAPFSLSVQDLENIIDKQAFEKFDADLFPEYDKVYENSTKVRFFVLNFVESICLQSQGSKFQMHINFKTPES